MFKFIYNFIQTSLKKIAKKDQLRYLSQSVLIEETRPPYTLRFALFFISSIILLLLIWAGFTQVDEIAVTLGEIVPSKHVQSLQHLEGGIISEIKVNEGDLVKEGQSLIILDGTAAKRDLNSLKNKKRSLEFNAIRLRAFINNSSPDFSKIANRVEDKSEITEQLKMFNSMLNAREEEKEIVIDQIKQKQAVIDGLRNKLETLNRSIKIAEEEQDLKKQLYKKGHLSKFNFMEVQKQFNDLLVELGQAESELSQSINSINEYKNRLESLEKNFIEKSYNDLHIVETDLEQINESIKKYADQVARLDIKSPTYGIVKYLAIRTIGGVLESGKIVAEIVPLEGNLIVETRISPKDIGYLKIGQKVKVKVSSYDYSRYGTVEGELTYISATTFVTEKGDRYYMGRANLDKSYVGKIPNENILVPGMTVEADIITGSKSILAYLLKPIRNSITSALTER